MHSTRRSSLWGTTKINTLIVCLLIFIITIYSFKCQTLQQINHSLSTDLNTLESECESLKQQIDIVEEEKTQLKSQIAKQSYAYNITAEERELLARLVYLEANTESLQCQKAIVSVVINRWENGYWGDTLKGVIYYEGQFTPASYINKTTPSNTNYQAVDYVLKNGVTVPQYVMYFRLNDHFKWDDYTAYKKIDNVCFGYKDHDKK